MEAILLRTPAGARFHFGEVAYHETTALENTATVLHADVLFSALVNGLAQTAPHAIEPFVEQVRTGQLRFSSGCYALEHAATGAVVWFLPKPVSLNLRPTADPKRLKAVQFLSRGVWERGLLPDDWFRENGDCLVVQNTFVALKTELPGTDDTLTVFRKQTTPKVKTRNANPNQEDGFYHQTDLHLTGNDRYRVSWYFLLHHTLPNDGRQQLDRLLAHLCLTGIGGERSTGCGALRGYETRLWPALTLPSAPAPAFAAMSLIIPASEADLSACQYYQVKQRGGRWAGQGQRLPILQALLEGAILNRPGAGMLADLSLPGAPPVLRYGYAFTIPLHPNYLPNDTDQ